MTEPYNISSTILPVIFWKKCMSCNTRYRFEKMWLVESESTSIVLRRDYICTHCAKDGKEARLKWIAATEVRS